LISKTCQDWWYDLVQITSNFFLPVVRRQIVQEERRKKEEERKTNGAQGDGGSSETNQSSIPSMRLMYRISILMAKLLNNLSNLFIFFGGNRFTDQAF
jgi:hypothetical protein